jgi:hypothetical protein
MKIFNHFRTAGLSLTVGLLAISNLAVAQDPAPAPAPQQSNGGWHRVGETNPAPNAANPDPAALAADPQGFPQNQPPPAPNLPGHLTVQPGTYVTVRVNQALSSDRNQAGDAFSMTLVRPIVVDGIVVADRGQTLGGRVTEAKKAGRVEGTSRLGITITDLPVVDGQQVPVQTQLIERQGPTSVGRDAGAIGATTVVGAAVGAGVGGPGGAAVGAGAGFLVSTVGVLLTRGHPTIVYPETVMTFKIEQPVTISTEHAPQAFRYVGPSDYQQAGPTRMVSRAPGYGAPPPGAAAYGPGYYPPYASPYGYGYGYGYGYPYYGPGFGLFIGGPGFYGGRFGGGRFGGGRFR